MAFCLPPEDVPRPVTPPTRWTLKQGRVPDRLLADALWLRTHFTPGRARVLVVMHTPTYRPRALVLDPVTGEARPLPLPDTEPVVSGVTFLPAGYLLYLDLSGRLTVMDLYRRRVHPGPRLPETAPVAHDEGGRVAAVDEAGAVWTFTPPTGRWVRTRPPEGDIADLVWLPDGGPLLVLTERRVWMGRPHAAGRPLLDLADTDRVLLLSSDALMVLREDGRRLEVWAAWQGRRLADRPLPQPMRHLWGLGTSSVLGQDEEGTLWLTDLPTGRTRPLGSAPGNLRLLSRSRTSATLLLGVPAKGMVWVLDGREGALHGPHDLRTRSLGQARPLGPGGFLVLSQDGAGDFADLLHPTMGVQRVWHLGKASGSSATLGPWGALWLGKDGTWTWLRDPSWG